jgi:hypothetical protein
LHLLNLAFELHFGLLWCLGGIEESGEFLAQGVGLVELRSMGKEPLQTGFLLVIQVGLVVTQGPERPFTILVIGCGWQGLFHVAKLVKVVPIVLGDMKAVNHQTSGHIRMGGDECFHGAGIAFISLVKVVIVERNATGISSRKLLTLVFFDRVAPPAHALCRCSA